MRGSEKRGSVSGDRDGKVVLCGKSSVVAVIKTEKQKVGKSQKTFKLLLQL